MKRVLLINPLMSAKAVYFPLGLGYIARALLDEGCEITVLDINAYRWSEDEVMRKVAASNFEVAGISALITQYPYVRWLTKTIKEVNPSAKIIVGGGLATAVPEMLLKKSEADIAVIGEGENTIKEVITCLDSSTSLGDVKGIWFKEDGDILRTELRAPIENLDSIPFPARSLFPMEKYTGSMDLRAFDPSIKAANMITSRGCPYNCAFCDQGIFGRKFRARSVLNIIEEIQLLREEYKLNGIIFNDDVFVLDKGRVRLFCDELISRGIDIYWGGNGRANLMDAELLKKMASAKCKFIAYGIESGNQAILDALNKNVTLEQQKRAIELTWQAGIFPHGYLMIGMFGETRETIADTIKFCREVSCGLNFSFVTPFPSTALYQRAVEAGKITSLEELLQNDKLQDISTKPAVNLTDLPDEELIRLKRFSQYKLLMQKFSLKTILRLYRVTGGRRFVTSVARELLTLFKERALGLYARQGRR